MNHLLGFDPLKFLNITNVKDEEKDYLSKELLDKISSYLSLRLAQALKEDDSIKIEDSRELILVARNKIPDLDKKIKEFLSDFKKEFYKNLKP